MSLVLISLSLGCGNSETTLPVISPLEFGVPVISEVGEKIGVITKFSYITPLGETITYNPKTNNLLVFWRYGCDACKAELEYIQDFHEKHDTDLLVVCINDLSSVSLVIDVISEMDITFDIVFDPTGVLRIPYQIASVPDSLYVSENGEITARRRATIDEFTLQRLIGEIK